MRPSSSTLTVLLVAFTSPGRGRRPDHGVAQHLRPVPIACNEMAFWAASISADADVRW
jgi:hypothetical protein